MAKLITLRPTETTLSFSSSTRRIFTGKAKIVSNGADYWTEHVGEKHDVTNSFYSILLALANMADGKSTKGRFIFDELNNTPYEITIEKLED